MRRNGGVLVTVLLVLLAVAATASAKTASAKTASAKTASAKAVKLTPTTPATRGSTYVALGDSVTFGYQEPNTTPAPNYHHPDSFRGYPEQLGSALHLRVANFSCPGETSASLINDKAPSYGCEGAYRAVFPLHKAYANSQLPAAVSYLKQHAKVRLVSLMIGANDLFRCQTFTPQHCTTAAERNAALSAVKRNVHHILAAVRGRARYSGQIVILSYFPALGNSSATAIVGALNGAQDAGARPFHVRFANGYGEFVTASRKFGDSACLAGLLTQLGAPGDCGVHPSYAGQTLLAKAVAAATIF